MKLLIIDDNERLALRTKVRLKKWYLIDVVLSGEEGLQTLAGAPYDLVVLDLGLPGIGGAEVCQHIKKLWPEVAVLVVTGEDSTKSKVSLLDLGADEFIERLSLANIFTWLAYSLYDHIYDEPSPDIKSLPTAHIILRLAYTAIPELTEDSIALFNITDRAHARELQLCRFDPEKPIKIKNIPDSNELASLLSERSIAHCAGPATIAALSGQSTPVLIQALKEYCAARQLLDDIHDWQDDFLTGKWTYVTAHLVKTIKPPLRQTPRKLLPEMQAVFWRSEAMLLLRYCQSLIRNAAVHPAFTGKRGEDTPFHAVTLAPLSKVVDEDIHSIKSGHSLITQLSKTIIG